MNPLDEIKINLPKFTNKELVIADYILKNPVSAFQFTAEEIVKLAKSSKPAFIRMCQKIGYSGYADFRFALSRSLVSQNQTSVQSDYISSIANHYIDFIGQIPKMISIENLKEIASMIQNARKVKIFGYNRTGLSAQQLRLRMSKIGYDAEAITDLVLARDISSSLTSEDIFIMISIKMTHDIYAPFIRELHSVGCPIVLITMNVNHKLQDYINKTITLPFVSKSDLTTFYDDQAIIFIFIEILLNELAK